MVQGAFSNLFWQNEDLLASNTNPSRWWSHRRCLERRYRGVPPQTNRVLLRRDVMQRVVSCFLLFSSADVATAYPIDCAILLCMAGRFPASTECSAAKAEVIRRITPWPVEPPLQLWRCPMSGIPGLPASGSDTVPPEVAAYLDAIEVWQLNKVVTTGSGGRDVYLTTIQGTYDASGRLNSRDMGEEDWPAWLEPEVRARTGSTLLNQYGASFRAILLRTPDHTGAYSTEWVSY